MTTAGGVRFDEIRTHADRLAAAQLFADIWGVPLAETPVPADLMVSLAHAGGCVLGAWTGTGELVGATVGFVGGPGSDSLFSYIAGVGPSFAGRGLGRGLKLAQRDWALARGATSMTWTYDPLIRRNAHFNLDRLGARVEEFLTDYYPPMHDAVNRGDLPDRFYVRWTLTEPVGGPTLPNAASDAPVVLAEGEGGPVRAAFAGQDLVRTYLPPDIEGLRRRDPQAAMRWREASREVFAELFAAGLRPVGVDDSGHYVFTTVTQEDHP